MIYISTKKTDKRRTKPKTKEKPKTVFMAQSRYRFFETKLTDLIFD